MSTGWALTRLRAVGVALLGARRSLLVAWVLVWMGLIWTLSSREPSGEPSPLVLSWLSNCGHAPLFGLLALWVVPLLDRGRAWVRLDARRLALVLAGVLAYAVVDELHQSTVPGRDATPWDVLTDMTGAACTLWVVAYVGREGASERGLWRRLAAGVLLCGIAGGLATAL